LAAHGRKAIYPFAEIDRLDGEKEATLGGQLEHVGGSKNVRITAASGRCGSRA
jgi:hypothetical protein